MWVTGTSCPCACCSALLRHGSSLGHIRALLLRKHAASRRAGAESNPNCGEALFLTRTLLCCSAVSLATC